MFNIRPLKEGRHPKGKANVFQSHHFSGSMLNFEGSIANFFVHLLFQVQKKILKNVWMFQEVSKWLVPTDEWGILGLYPMHLLNLY